MLRREVKKTLITVVSWIVFTNAYIAGGVEDIGADIFQRGVCLPSDNKMTAEEQELVIEVIRGCFE